MTAQAKTEPVFLSVIVAAYEAEAYVEACIDSICGAGCAGIEILIVLGESSDRTNAICRSYETRGLAVCVMQDGKGLSDARNCGMKKAAGEYLTFVDADDRVDTEKFAACVRFLKQALRTQSYDVLVNDFLFADHSGKILFESGQMKNGMGRRELVRAKGTFWNAWRYIYRTAYVCGHNRYFLENHSCEDLEFAVRTLLDTRRAAFLHMPYYCYCPVRPGSLMHRKDLKMIRDFWLVERMLLSLCRKDASLLAQDMEKKLAELMVLNLPDIWEVSGCERQAVLRGYRRQSARIRRTGSWWVRLSVCLCRAGLIVPVSFCLYLAKRMRRQWRYHGR